MQIEVTQADIERADAFRAELSAINIGNMTTCCPIAQAFIDLGEKKVRAWGTGVVQTSRGKWWMSMSLMKQMRAWDMGDGFSPGRYRLREMETPR